MRIFSCPTSPTTPNQPPWYLLTWWIFKQISFATWDLQQIHFPQGDTLIFVFSLNNQFFTPLKTIKTTPQKKKKTQPTNKNETDLNQKTKKETPPGLHLHQTTKKPRPFSCFRPSLASSFQRPAHASQTPHPRCLPRRPWRTGPLHHWRPHRPPGSVGHGGGGWFRGVSNRGAKVVTKPVTFLGRKTKNLYIKRSVGKKLQLSCLCLACCWLFFVCPWFLVSKNTPPDAGWLQGGVPWRDSKVDMLKKSHRLFTLSGCGDTWRP